MSSLERRAEHSMEEATEAQQVLDAMVDGGGPASDEEAFRFQAEMTHRFAHQLSHLSEEVRELTERLSALQGSGGRYGIGASTAAVDARKESLDRPGQRNPEDGSAAEGPGHQEGRSSRWKEWSRRDRILPKTKRLSPSSRLLHRIDHLSSLPGTALLCGALLISAVVVGALLAFSSDWETAFVVATSVITLEMVFVIQHTQGREQAATQRKLDELLRALPEAESGLMMLEEASDEELHDVEVVQRETKDGVLEHTRGGVTAPVHEGGPA
jgi:low affinity Fe/Cu permease